MPDRDPRAGDLIGETLQQVARSTTTEPSGVPRGRAFVDKLDVYKVAEKVFRIVTDDPDKPIIAVKAEPEQARRPQGADREPSRRRLRSADGVGTRHGGRATSGKGHGGGTRLR